jgi:hypothetical protein
MLNTLNFLAIAFAFFGTWMYVMRWLAGWARLQTLYAVKPNTLTEQISNGSFRWVGCRLRWTSITVAIELYPKGLFLRPSFPLNMALHAVCIPWPAIDAYNHQTLLSRKTTLQIDGYPWPLHILGHPGSVIEAHIQALLASAEQVVQTHESITLQATDFQALLTALDAPTEANAALEKASQAHANCVLK